MTAQRLNPILRVIPSLTDLAFLMPIVFLFARMEGTKTLLADGDTGWHIRTGEWILANGRVPNKDIFSFSKSGETWYAWEWLWDVCFAWLYHHGGLATVVTASLVIICLTFALLFRLVQRHCDNPFVAMAITFLACAVSALHWLARPHLITMLFTVILLYVLARAREGQTRLLLVLPIFMVLWTNLHGGFLAALIILCAYSAGEAARALFVPASEERNAAWKRARQFGLTTAACAIATLVNPYTFHLHTHIYQFFAEPYHVQNIAEYQSISFHAAPAVYLEVMLLVGALSAAWFVKRRDFVPIVLIGGWAHLALFSARNLPIFALVTAPFAAQALNEILKRVEQARIAPWFQRFIRSLRDTGSEFAELDQAWRTHVASAAVVVLIALLIASPNAEGKWKAEYDPQKYPSKAISLLRANPSWRVFADDEWGDYLLYQLYPTNKVFVDGRDDFYGQDFEQKYLDVVNVKYDWEQYLRGYKIDAIVLPTRSALASAIKESSHWRPIYDDTVAIVFRPSEKQAPDGQPKSTTLPGGDNRGPAITKAAPRDCKIAAPQTKGA
jgi:hypothetical protein